MSHPSDRTGQRWLFSSKSLTDDATVVAEARERLSAFLKSDGPARYSGRPFADEGTILGLSDPPYYTACVNPFVAEVLDSPRDAVLQEESREEGQVFDADIEEGKGDALYGVHGYHTKVPPRAVLRFLLHYTRPGDVVLDAFCGTGMVGVAGHLAAAPPDDLRSELDAESRRAGKAAPMWGARRVVLSDLSPAATYIARAYNDPAMFGERLNEAEAAVAAVEDELGWMYLTGTGRSRGRVEYAIWSDVFACPECTTEASFWELAVDVDAGIVRDSFACPACSAVLSKRSLERAWETYFDDRLGSAQRIPKQALVRLNCSISGVTGRVDREAGPDDWAVIERIRQLDWRGWFPTQAFPQGEKTSEPIRLGIKHVHQLFTRRNLIAFSALWNRMPTELRWLITGTLQRGSKQHQIAISRIGGPKKGVGGATAGHRRGTLYVPSNQVEMNVFQLVRERIAAARRARYSGGPRPVISTGSAATLPLPDASVDYIFTDPPFGANIMYSELSFLWEAWLGCFTNREEEAVQSKIQGKGITEYHSLMRGCFSEYFRVLRSGKWMTVEFSNTQAAVWNVLQTALEQAGFVVASVNTLSKKRGGLNAIVGKTAVNQDLALACYKPKESSRIPGAGTSAADFTQRVWWFVEQHLDYLPVFREEEGQAVEIAERSARSVYDRLVAYCVSRSLAVPMSSPEFQSGLAQRFPVRDGMYFLPGQVAEYDRKRTTVSALRQLRLFVDDEESAIQWLRQQLHDKPRSFQDLQPQFMRELQGWAKHEETVELKTLLDQSFLYYDGRGPVPGQIHRYLSSNFKDLRNLGNDDRRLVEKARDRWYVPDPNKQADLEQLRERALLREFEEYKTSTQRKLKVFRTEAVRAGFKACWQERDYGTIVKVAGKLPDAVLQEDEKLIMYYDNALTRLGDE